eukprot:TRINITY_DN9770_c0_g1_i2.p1 TRINITY_DN9770_c0_g1~~TRINITY_DN9770_c0_g1_i2.p1  ORF type:complete len:241 (+),score=23.69 TRINITY_DN9770_c0_g1_i2:87-809(+)
MAVSGMTSAVLCGPARQLLCFHLWHIRDEELASDGLPASSPAETGHLAAWYSATTAVNLIRYAATRAIWHPRHILDVFIMTINSLAPLASSAHGAWPHAFPPQDAVAPADRDRWASIASADVAVTPVIAPLLLDFVVHASWGRASHRLHEHMEACGSPDVRVRAFTPQAKATLLDRLLHAPAHRRRRRRLTERDKKERAEMADVALRRVAVTAPSDAWAAAGDTHMTSSAWRPRQPIQRG